MILNLVLQQCAWKEIRMEEQHKNAKNLWHITQTQSYDILLKTLKGLLNIYSIYLGMEISKKSFRKEL